MVSPLIDWLIVCFVFSEIHLSDATNAVAGQGSKRHTNETGHHTTTKRIRKHRKEGFHCSICMAQFENCRELFRHRMSQHFDNSLLENNGNFTETFPWLSESADVIPALQQIFRDSRGYIIERPIVDDARSVLNRAVIASAETDTQQWWEQISEFFQDVAQTHTENLYKFNFSFDYILQHVDTHEFRYYVAGENGVYLPSPVLARRPDDMRLGFLDNAAAQDLWQHMFNARPSRKWIPKFITNVSLYLYHVNYVTGAVTN